MVKPHIFTLLTENIQHYKIMKWVLDEERGCITENADPILEASFNDIKSREALKLASKSPEMLELLQQVVFLQEDNYGDGSRTHLLLISKVKEIKNLIKKLK